MEIRAGESEESGRGWGPDAGAEDCMAEEGTAVDG